MHLSLLAAALWTASLLAQAQAQALPQPAPRVKATRLAEGFHVLSGAGCNITVSSGEDGLLLVDDGLPRFKEDLKGALAVLGPLPVRIVLNTNWHFDHADGNAWLAEAGALVVAHEVSRAHMTRETRAPELDPDWVIAPYPPLALPRVTCREGLSVHFNGQEVRAVHIPGAHSDCDLLFHFPKANLIHAGDLFFPGAIPFINYTSGGSLEGMIRGADRILGLADAGTRIVPGHGPVSGRSEVQAFRDLLAAIRDAVAAQVAAGRTVEEAVAAHPLASLYTGRRAYFKAETLTRYAFLELQGAKARK